MGCSHAGDTLLEMFAIFANQMCSPLEWSLYQSLPHLNMVFSHECTMQNHGVTVTPTSQASSTTDPADNLFAHTAVPGLLQCR